MGNKGRWEYLRAIYERYRQAGRKSKKVILNEFCANTGYQRKYAIRLVNRERPEKRPAAAASARGGLRPGNPGRADVGVGGAAGYPWSLRLNRLRKNAKICSSAAKKLAEQAPRKEGAARHRLCRS